VFGLATSLGMHFIPFAWLYRFGPYAALAVWSVLGASLAQVFLAADASRVIPIGMGIGYALAAFGAHRAMAKNAIVNEAGLLKRALELLHESVLSVFVRNFDLFTQRR